MLTFARIQLTFSALLVSAGLAVGQPPVEVKVQKQPKPPPDELSVSVKEIQEAYKAPFEFDEDVRDELRKQYKNPTPEREAKLFYEIRRLYQTTPQEEEAILREVRRAYELQTPEQEKRLFSTIARSDKLPLGTVHPTTQLEQATKMFRRLDQDGNGVLGPDELSGTLRGQQARWDRDRNGAIDATEYGSFFVSNHQIVADAVASGEIPLKLPKGMPGPGSQPNPAPARQADARKPVPLPKWFTEFDSDGDGQLGLYEWRRAGRTIKDFVPMDLNEDGYLTAWELRTFLANQPATKK